MVSLLSPDLPRDPGLQVPLLCPGKAHGLCVVFVSLTRPHSLLEKIEQETWRETGISFVTSVTRLMERLLDYRYCSGTSWPQDTLSSGASLDLEAETRCRSGRAALVLRAIASH